MTSKATLIIGAGQLGSRHLQGLLKCKIKQTIYVLDPSGLSLGNCKSRESEIEHDHVVVYTQNWNPIPPSLNLVIISTNSNVRSAVLRQLLEHSTAENIILEKVLFQSLAEYDDVSALILGNRICQFWVNHQRRESSFYTGLKSRIEEGHTTIHSVSVYGEDWGLGCNSLHFIDMLSFIMNSDLALLDAMMLDNEMVRSKRDGFVEFTGSVNGKFENGTFINLVSTKSAKISGSYSKKIYINISTDIENILINESVNPITFFYNKDENSNIEIVPFNLKFQSEFTTDVSTSLLNNNGCRLPTFMQAYTNHKIFVKALLKKFNTITNTTATHLPIT